MLGVGWEGGGWGVGDEAEHEVLNCEWVYAGGISSLTEGPFPILT